MKKILKLLQSNIKEMLRDKTALFWTIMFPVLFIAIFGMVYANEDIPPIAVGLAVNDTTGATDPLVKVFEEVELFDLQQGEEEELEERLRRGEINALIIIGENFGRDFALKRAEILLKYDPAKRTVNNIILSAVQAVVERVNQAVTNVQNPISVSSVEFRAENNRQIDWLVPGILGMSIMQLGLFSSAAFVALREKKIFRRFAVTPLQRHHLVISQVLFRLVFGLIQAIILLLFGYLLYEVVIKGALLTLLVVLIVAVVMFLAMGYIIASVAKSEEAVEPIVQVVSMPMMFLSGVFFPIELMPEFIRPAVKALPLTHLNEALRAVINMGAGLGEITSELGMMVAWLVGSMLVAVKVFRWE